MYTPKKKNKFIDNLVSIIMPAFNSAGYICESIDSVLAQTYAEWELWVVDDGSMDNTADIVKNFKDNDHLVDVIKKYKSLSKVRRGEITISDLLLG